ncbi:MAG: hypothetical protein ALAOOOJD_00772 [bacterium]|nr:hypothetical protein [bacterium]
MHKSKAELEREISACVSDFLLTQLGESARSVTTSLAADTATVRATNCLSPGERLLVRDEQGWRLFQEFKNQQFEKVKANLQKRLEQITASKVLNIVSVLEQNGIRFELVTLNRNFDN